MCKLIAINPSTYIVQVQGLKVIADIATGKITAKRNIKLTHRWSPRDQEQHLQNASHILL